jgi:CHRD domain
VQKAIVLIGVVALLAAGCGGDDEGSASGGGSVTMQLSEQNGSGESGTATLTAEGESTRVEIDISNGTSEPQPAHIHEGSCANLNPTPKYALQNVVDGKSTSTVAASLDDLKSEAYAINVHKSAMELQTYVSCGDIGGSGGDDSEGGGSGY